MRSPASLDRCNVCRYRRHVVVVPEHDSDGSEQGKGKTTMNYSAIQRHRGVKSQCCSARAKRPRVGFTRLRNRRRALRIVSYGCHGQGNGQRCGVRADKCTKLGVDIQRATPIFFTCTNRRECTPGRNLQRVRSRCQALRKNICFPQISKRSTLYSGRAKANPTVRMDVDFFWGKRVRRGPTKE